MKHNHGFLAAVTSIAILAVPGVRSAERPDIILIAVDDLRPPVGEIGRDDSGYAKTPHLDRFARSAVHFQRAYCQVASCCPSRTAALTGLRPESTGVFSNGSPHFREKFPKVVTLPQHFKNHGWFCKELGKVFHRRDPKSWSEPKWIPEPDFAYPIYGTEANLAIQKAAKITRKPDDWWGFDRWIKAASWEAPDVPDKALFDGKLAMQAIAELRRERENDQPLFLAIGFFRPHLPFIAPKRYYDLYPEGSLKLPENRHRPEGAPECSVHDSSEPRSYLDISRDGPIPMDKQRELLRGYCASVSFVDAQIGRVLDELDRQGRHDSSIVVIWSDHGYHFGEQGIWGKATNFESATRSTLLVSAPGFRGSQPRGLVELVDLFPSLCELASLEEPEGLEGGSFVPLMRDPGREWKGRVFSWASPRRAEGISMRTEHHRYTEWTRDGEVVATELYDCVADPEETRNLFPEADPELLQFLRSQFRKGWNKALPEP